MTSTRGSHKSLLCLRLSAHLFGSEAVQIGALLIVPCCHRKTHLVQPAFSAVRLCKSVPCSLLPWISIHPKAVEPCCRPKWASPRREAIQYSWESTSAPTKLQPEGARTIDFNSLPMLRKEIKFYQLLHTCLLPVYSKSRTTLLFL